MPLDTAFVDPNFGFDPSFVRCSSDPQIVFDYRGYSQNTICRRLLTSDITDYANQLTRNIQYAARMRALHKFSLIAHFTDSDKIRFEVPTGYTGVASYLANINHRAGITDLEDLFPEDKARPTVEKIKEFCHESRIIHRSKDAVDISFHTKLQKEDMGLHKDDKVQVAMLIIQHGTIIIPDDACEYEAGKYKCLDKSRIQQAQPGDLLVAKTVHGECTIEFAEPDDEFRLALRSQPHFIDLDAD